jgi:carbohydrate-binding DOMON domain-containing protein
MPKAEIPNRNFSLKTNLLVLFRRTWGINFINQLYLNSSQNMKLFSQNILQSGALSSQGG